MKTTQKILGILWIAICGFFCISLSLATYHTLTATSYRLDGLVIDSFFVLLYLVGTVGSVYVVCGARWARILVGMVALLTVMASLIGLFAFFSFAPYSAVGVAFDIFVAISAVILLSSRRLASA